MARLCLPKEARDKMVAGLRSGEIDLGALSQMDDAARNKLFSKYVGNDFASTLNAKFEAALLSNQKNALANWVKKATNLSEPIRRNMQKKVDNLSKALAKSDTDDFLSDLVEDKMGLKMSDEEVQTMFDLKKAIDDAEAKLTPDMPAGSPEGLEYGLAVRMFDKYVDGLKATAESVTTKEALTSFKGAWEATKGIGGLAKSLVASIDASFPGRQGFKLFLDGKYKIWAKGVATDLKVLAKTLATNRKANIQPIDLVWAEIYSRPNFRNGMYKAAKNGYGFVGREEAFPTSLPARIPGFGRFFRASEDAYNATATRMRADLADAFIAKAQQDGLDVMDEEVATGLGTVVSAMTGRGNIRGLEPVAKTLNNLLFSPRFLMANIDTLTAHISDPKATLYAKKEAAKSLLRMGASLGTILAIWKAFDPVAVDNDPRKGRFGKVRIGQNDIDLTGGMGGLVQLASRLVPFTEVDGVKGAWKYSPQTRKWTNMLDPEYGESTMMSYIGQFFQGKLSPTAGAFRDYLNRSDFDGNTPTLKSTIGNLVMPISTETIIKGFKNGNDHMFAISLAEMFGFSSSNTTMRGYGKNFEKLKVKIPEEQYNKVLLKMTEEFNKEAQMFEDSYMFATMDNKERSAELDKIRARISDEIFVRYGVK